MALLDRLENDRSLAGFAGQFVPLKIITDGNPQWNEWESKYPVDGRGIPRLYVVRADGEQLYGAVGSLPGNMLPQMMLATLKQAGRVLSDADAVLLDESVSAAQTALDAGDFLTASVTLSEVTKLGSPDELGSYADPALRAASLYEKLVSVIDSEVEKAQDELFRSDIEDPLDLLLVIHGAEAAYKLFPKLKAKASVTRELKKKNWYAEPLAQAEGLVKARVLSASKNPRLRRRASAAYVAVIRRYPGTRADEIARAELAEIEPDGKILNTMTQTPGPTPEPAPSSTATYREWTAVNNNFKTKAKYVQQKDGKVQLIKENGQTIVVDISLLSDQDRAFLRRQP